MEDILISTVHLSEDPEYVVLLHGLSRTARSMIKLEQAFRKLGYRVVNLTYSSRKYPIEKLSRLAIDSALSRRKRKEKTQVHFVAHSLGGILVRHYLENTKLQNLGRVVMIASPNQGSHLVDKFGSCPGFRAVNGPAGAQLGTNSHSTPVQLGAVNYPVGVIAGTRTVNLILSQFLPGVNDGRVITENTKVEGMADYIELPTSHPFIIQNAYAIRQATNFIRTGVFQKDETMKKISV
ncbi:MAG: alpha/beta hydrolase [Chloroflexi bacterium]|nr:alpha/beta hydrolase [Chloroflexota bacterium]